MAIWRFATAESLTRNGGKIEKDSATTHLSLKTGLKLIGQWLVITLFILTKHLQKSSTGQGQSIPTAAAFLMLS